MITPGCHYDAAEPWAREPRLSGIDLRPRRRRWPAWLFYVGLAVVGYAIGWLTR